MLTFRKKHAHVDDAYYVIFEGIAIGAITKRRVRHQADQWAWEIYLFGRVVPGISGREDSGDRAVEAFRAAWERCVTPVDLEWIRQRAMPTKTHRDIKPVRALSSSSKPSVD